MEPRREDVEYEIDTTAGYLLMLTNEDAPNFRLLASTPADARDAAAGSR